MIASGGQVNSSYLQLLDLPISEAIYHLDIYQEVQVIIYPEVKKKTAKGKLAQWGLTEKDFDIDFEVE